MSGMGLSPIRWLTCGVRSTADREARADGEVARRQLAQSPVLVGEPAHQAAHSLVWTGGRGDPQGQQQVPAQGGQLVHLKIPDPAAG
jgi:hypothetical protein